MSADKFAAQVRAFSELGYRTVTAKDLGVDWRNVCADGPRLWITFDDGFRSVYQNAAGILDKYGFRATIFLSTAAVGGVWSIPWEGQRTDLQMLSWSEIRELERHGFEIGSHGHNHNALAQVPWEQAVFDVRTSTERISHELGRKPTAFAYPFGSAKTFCAHTKTLIAAEGYTVCCTMIQRSASAKDELLSLPRMCVFCTDSIQSIKDKLSGRQDRTTRLVQECQRIGGLLRRRNHCLHGQHFRPTARPERPLSE